MCERNLECCVVRDLLPVYLEELTEDETSAMVRAHIDQCDSCRRTAEHMKTQIPVEKAPKRALKFLKRVKRIRLMAAVVAAVAAMFCMWWLYDDAYHYANTEAGRLAAVYDYCAQPEENARVIAWQTMEDHLFLFYGIDTREHVHGFLHLVRGWNGKYRTLQSSYGPSQYTAGVYGERLEPRGTDWELFILAGDNCRDIYEAQVHFGVHSLTGADVEPVVKSYGLSEPSFLWIMEEAELLRELGFEDENVVRPYILDVRLLDKHGQDITDAYRDESMTSSWGAGTGTAELSAVYVYMAIVGALGIVCIYCFLRKD